MAISKEVLIQAVRSYQSKYSTFRFREVKDLKPKQIETALTRICPHVKQAEVVAFWDETMFGSGKKGFLLTCDTLYFSKEYYIDGNKSKHNVTISDFDTVKKMVGRPNCVGIVHKNGETEWVYVSINQDDLFEFFCKVIQFRNEEKHACKEEAFRDPEPDESFGHYSFEFTAHYSQQQVNAQREGRETSCTLSGLALMDLIEERYETVNGPVSGFTCPGCGGKLRRLPGQQENHRNPCKRHHPEENLYSGVFLFLHNQPPRFFLLLYPFDAKDMPMDAKASYHRRNAKMLLIVEELCYNIPVPVV